jgi:hypothetical protein
MSDEKHCGKCQQIWPLSKFGPDRKRSDGLKSWCKGCLSAHERARRQANPEHIRQLELAARQANPDVYRASNKRATARYRAKRREEKVASAPEHICKFCDCRFRTTDARKQYCSAVCRKNFVNRSPRPFRTSARKRARKFGVEYEYINALHVFERDNWLCQVCGRKTPKAWRGTCRDRAPELDHRVPMALGGGHVWGNVQCACRKCNQIRKRDKLVLGQLSLLGKPNAVTLTVEQAPIGSVPKTLMKCELCDQPFGTRLSRQRFCSKICQRSYWIQDRAQKNALLRLAGIYRPRLSRSKNAVPGQLAIPRPTTLARMDHPWRSGRSDEPAAVPGRPLARRR